MNAMADDISPDLSGLVEAFRRRLWWIETRRRALRAVGWTAACLLGLVAVHRGVAAMPFAASLALALAPPLLACVASLTVLRPSRARAVHEADRHFGAQTLLLAAYETRASQPRGTLARALLRQRADRAAAAWRAQLALEPLPAAPRGAGAATAAALAGMLLLYLPGVAPSRQAHALGSPDAPLHAPGASAPQGTTDPLARAPEPPAEAARSNPPATPGGSAGTRPAKAGSAPVAMAPPDGGPDAMARAGAAAITATAASDVPGTAPGLPAAADTGRAPALAVVTRTVDRPEAAANEPVAAGDAHPLASSGLATTSRPSDAPLRLTDAAEGPPRADLSILQRAHVARYFKALAELPR